MTHQWSNEIDDTLFKGQSHGTVPVDAFDHYGYWRFCAAETQSDNQPCSVSPHLDAPMTPHGAKGGLPGVQDDAPLCLDVK